MNKTQCKNLIRILMTLLLVIVISFLRVDDTMRFILYLFPYVLIGYDILIKALKGIGNREALDENVLIAVATIGAIILARLETGEYVEAIAVMLLYQVGEWFQSYATGKSRRDIVELMRIVPEYANREKADGQLEKVAPDAVEIGSIIVVKPGERIPLDGYVLSGSSSLNVASLTGESMPQDVEAGQAVVSGAINVSGLLKIKTTKEFGESTVSKILELMEAASGRKSNSEKFITKFARVYTPMVVMLSLVLAIVPPMVLYILHHPPMWGDWMYRALSFLIISCPCALVISIPLSFFAGIGGASRQGILVKGANYMETLSKVKTFVFDKTGTLTKGTFEVVKVHANELSKEELLRLAAYGEMYSTHPIAQSIRRAYPHALDASVVEHVEEISGQGIRAEIEGKVVHIGNKKFMQRLGVRGEETKPMGTVLHIAREGKYMGNIVMSDTLKETALHGIQALKKAGAHRIIMLTGDAKNVADTVSQMLGIGEVYSELLPGDKVEKVEQFIQERKEREDQLAFVGDGVNDAPVLSIADVGIAMGAMGSDAAIEAADVVLMDDDPLKIATALRISRKCLRIVKENICFSIGVKAIVLVAAAMGMTTLWEAIFADVGVTILAVFNAMRCMKVD